MAHSEKKSSPKQYVETPSLVDDVCKTLEVKNVIPAKTPKLIEELASVFDRCIERNVLGEPSKLLVFPAKTGTSKSLTTKMYVSQLKDTPSIIVVPRVDDAIKFCEDINTFRGEDVYARCYYSLGSNTDSELRVEKEQLTHYQCIVITHKMFLDANKMNDIKDLKSYGAKSRDLVVIDERINLSETISINNKEVDKLIEFVENLQKSGRYPNLDDELDRLQLFKYHMNKERTFCTDNNIREGAFDPLYCSEDEPWSFGSLECILFDSGSKISELYGHSKSTRTSENEQKLKNDLKEHLRVIELSYFGEHTLHKKGADTLISVHSPIESHLGSVVVLDATAHINAQYKAFEILRPDDIQLFTPTNPRRYDNLTIYKAKGLHQSRSSIYTEKTSSKVKDLDAKEYIDFARSLLKNKDDKVLIVTFKDYTDYLKKHIKPAENISLTHYGNHVGKNDWIDHNKVIILGWNYLPDDAHLSKYIGITGDLDTSFAYDLKEIKDVYGKTGIVDDLIQATMRGTARTTIDTLGNCPKSEVYLFYPDTPIGKEIVSMYTDEFDGAKTVDIPLPVVTVVKKPTKKMMNQAKIVEYLEAQQVKGATFVKDTDVKNDTGILKSTYSDLLKNREFLDTLAQKSFKHTHLDGRTKGFLIESSEFS